ncbi:MAG: IS481 family transposase, partial [Bosea sp.]|nr:IS481 family transposase [Bosea sp. (in: a-proteobacteria)]
MNIHKNTRLTLLGRERIVRMAASGTASSEIAVRVGVSVKTVHKWIARFAAEGMAGLADRSSRPHRLHRPTPDGQVEQIIALRRRRLSGKAIAKQVGVSPATVSRVLRRARLSRMRDLDPVEPARRYERAHPGDLIHVDIKTLNRFSEPGHRVTGDRGGSRSIGAGWEFAHVCIDDASRLAFVEMKPDEKAVSAVAFLRAAVAYYGHLGVTVARVMTDNGSCYKAHAFRHACRDLGLRHIRTKPYTPRTNGKAERFIQTALREWAYARPYAHSDRRAEELPRWLHHYNRASEHPSVYVIEEKRFCSVGCDPAGYLGFCRARTVIDWAA